MANRKRISKSSDTIDVAWKCSHSSVILMRPKFKLDVDLCEQNVCYVCGRICPKPVAECDAALSIDRIEQQVGEFAKQATPKEVIAFADYVCKVLKNIIQSASDEYLEKVIATEECNGFKYLLIAEASKRKDEITDWKTYIAPDFVVVVELYPKGFFRAVPMRMIKIVPGVIENED